jgi:hypothetical protein
VKIVLQAVEFFVNRSREAAEIVGAWNAACNRHFSGAGCGSWPPSRLHPLFRLLKSAVANADETLEGTMDICDRYQ